MVKSIAGNAMSNGFDPTELLGVQVQEISKCTSLLVNQRCRWLECIEAGQAHETNKADGGHTAPKRFGSDGCLRLYAIKKLDVRNRHWAIRFYPPVLAGTNCFNSTSSVLLSTPTPCFGSVFR